MDRKKKKAAKNKRRSRLRESVGSSVTLFPTHSITLEKSHSRSSVRKALGGSGGEGGVILEV